MFVKKCFFSILSCFIIVSFLPKPILSKEAFTHPFLPQTHQVFLNNVIPTSSHTLYATFSLKDLIIEKGENGYFFRLNQNGFVTEEGTPQLPRIDKIITLREHQVVVSVDTLSMTTKEMVLPNIPIQLIPPLQPYNGKKKINREIKSYIDSNKIDQFPKENFEVQSCFTNNKRFIRIKIHPVYLRSGKWYFTESIQIRINFADEEKEKLPNIRKKDSIILTPDIFAEEANQLKSIQEKQGYTVNILKLSSIASLPMAARPKSDGYKGYADFPLETIKSINKYDDATARKIITWLQQKLQKDEADYLTILGDSQLIPPSYYIYTGDGSQGFENWIPTDQFYASPFNKAEDFTFHLKVGRIPVRSNTEMQTYLSKMTSYIANLDINWFSQAAVMGGDPFDGEYMGELMISSTINQDRLNGFKIEKYFRTEDKFNLPSFKELMQNQDKGLIYEIGHGSGSELYLESGMADVNFCYSLPKKDKLPIMLSIACMNGAWDTQLFPELFKTPKKSQFPTSFSQSMLFSQNGAIAYIGGSRNNYGYIDFDIDNGIIKLDEEASYMGHVLSRFCLYLHENTGTLGDISNKTMQSYIESDWGYRYTAGADTFFGYILMGDPTLILPKLEVTKPFSAPELSTSEEWKMNSDGLPLCPIDDGFKMSILSNSPSLQYKIAEYGTEKNALKDTGTIKNQSQTGSNTTFNPTWKAQLALRIETEDYKENRFMFWSKYYHDLVIQSRPALSSLRPGEQQKLRFTLVNDGIDDEKNVRATIVYNDQEKAFDFPSFPFLSQNYLWLDVNYQTLEETEIIVSAKTLPNEKNTVDNQYQFTLRSPKELFYRVGYWSDSIFLEGSRKPIELTDRLNQAMDKAGFPVEFFPLNLKQDLIENTFMSDRLKPDCVILDSPDAFDYNFAPSYRNLSEYLAQGGKIISFGSIGKNAYDFSIQCMYPLLHITSETDLSTIDITENQTTFRIDESVRSQFSKAEYSLPFEDAFLPINEVAFSSFFEDPASVGSLKGSGVDLVDTGSVSVINATFEWSRLDTNHDLSAFLYDLVHYMSQKPSMPILKSVKLDPPIGSKNQSSNGTAYIEYFGNEATTPLELQIKGDPGWEQIIPVEILQPYESRKIPFELEHKKINGNKSIEITLQTTAETGETKVLSRLNQPYTILDSNEPDEPPALVIKGEKTNSTTDSQWLIEGTTNAKAEVFINQKPFGVNEDGSFQVLQPLSEGSNEFHITSSQGSLSSEETITVERLQLIQISLPIGKKFCLLNGQEKSLDEPALIVNGSTFVPIRFLAEAFQIQIDWVAKEQKITLFQNGLRIELWIGKKIALINGKDYQLSNPPFIRNGRTLLPIRFIAEGLKANVVWNKENQEVFIRMGIPYQKATPTSLNFQVVETEEDGPVVLDQPLPDEYAFPLCIDQYQDKIYAITNQDIVIYNENFEIIQKTPIPESFWLGGDIKTQQTLLSLVNRALLRVNEKYLILTDTTATVYIYSRETLELISKIQNEEYGLTLSSDRLFRNIMEMEISEDGLLYLCDPYGILVYDLNHQLLTTTLNIRYGADIVLTTDKIYVSSISDIDIYTLQGGHIKTIETEEYYIFSYSMVLYDNETLLVSDPLDHALRLIKEDGSIEKKIPLTSKFGYLLEKMIKTGDKFYILSLVTSKKIPYIQTKLIEIDNKYKITKESHKNLTKDIKNLKMYLPNPIGVFLTENNTRYLNLLNPLSTINFVRIPPEADEIEEIPIDVEYESSSYLDSVLDLYFHQEDEQVGLLIINLMSLKSTVFIYDFQEEESSAIQLKTKKEYSLITSFAFDNDKVVGYDEFFCEFVVFDRETSEEIERFSVIPDLNPNSVSDIILRKDNIYFMDKTSHFIHSFQLNGKTKPVLNATNFFPNNGSGLSSYDVDTDGNVFVLDHISGTVTSIGEEQINQWGTSQRIMEANSLSTHFQEYYHPSLIGVNSSRVMVYDFGNQRLVELPKNTKKAAIAKPTVVQVFPDIVQTEFFREKEIQIPISLQVFCQKGEITVSNLPAYIQLKNFTPAKSSQVFHLVIDPSGLTEEKTETFTVTCNEISQTIKVTLKPLQSYLTGKHDSPYVHFPNGYFLSKSPITIQNGIVVAGEDFLRFYGIDVLVAGKEIQLTHTGITLIFYTETNEGFLYLNKTKVPFKTDIPLKKDQYQWLIPLNSILDLFSKPVTVNQNAVNFIY